MELDKVNSIPCDTPISSRIRPRYKPLYRLHKKYDAMKDHNRFCLFMYTLFFGALGVNSYFTPLWLQIISWIVIGILAVSRVVYLYT